MSDDQRLGLEGLEGASVKTFSLRLCSKGHQSSNRRSPRSLNQRIRLPPTLRTNCIIVHITVHAQYALSFAAPEFAPY